MSCNFEKAHSILNAIGGLSNKFSIENNKKQVIPKDNIELSTFVAAITADTIKAKNEYETIKQKNKQAVKDYYVKEVFDFNANKKYITFGGLTENPKITDIIRFNGRTLLNSVNLKDNETFPLHNREKEVIDETSNAIVKALSVVPTNQNSFSTKARKENPALNFLGVNEVHPNIAVAIRNSIDNYMINNHTLLTTELTAKDIADMFFDGNTKNIAKLDPDIMEKFANGGIQAAFAANEIGKEILSSLGMLPVKTANSVEFPALIAGFGQIALLTMSELGYIKNLRPIADKDRINHLKTYEDFHNFLQNDGKYVRRRRDNQNLFYIENGVFVSDGYNIDHSKSNNIILSDLVGSKPNRVHPSFDKPDFKERIKVKRNNVTDAPLEQTFAVVKLKSMEWDFDTDSMDKLEELFPNWANNEDVLSAMGYPKEDNTPHSKSTALAMKGKRQAVKDKIKQLSDFYAEYQNEKKPFYYDWFIGQNLRLHIKNKVNPQDDKILTRWFISPKGMSSNIKISDLHEVLKDPNGTDRQEIRNFIMGIVQGLDGVKVKDSDGNDINIPDPEKALPKDVFKVAEKLINLDPKELARAIQTSAKGGKGHLGHAILALTNIERYQKNDTEFTSTILRETDGKTNGYAHKVLQMPLSGFEKLLKAVGIRDIDETYTDSEGTHPLNSTIQATATKMNGDVYQLIGLDFINEHNNVLSSLSPNTRSAYKDFIKLLEKNYQLPEEFIDNAVNVNKNVRNFVKPAATEVMYAAKAFSSAQARNKEIVAKLMDSLSANLDQEALSTIRTLIVSMKSDPYFAESNSEEQVAYFNDLAENFNHYLRSAGQLSVLKTNLTNFFDDSNVNAPLNDILLNLVNVAYGKPLEIALGNQFRSYEELNDTINTGMEYAYRVFNEAYRNKLTESLVANGGYITSEEQDKILKELVDIIPSINTAYSSDPSTKIMLVKKGLGADYINYKVEKSLNTIKDNSTNSVSIPTSHRSGTYNYTDPQVLKYHIGNIVTSMLKDTFKSPDASTLAVGTHGLDSTNMSVTLNNTLHRFVPVHDALVFGTGVTGITEGFNKSYYEMHQQHSMVQSVIDAIERSYIYSKNNDLNYLNEQDLTYRGKNKDPFTPIESEDHVPLTVDSIKESLKRYAEIISENRKNIFSTPKLVGQMVDMSGTMYASKPLSANEIVQPKVGNIQKVIKQIPENIPPIYVNKVKGTLEYLANICE